MQELKEFLDNPQKPLFVSDIDVNSLNGAWKDFFKPEEERIKKGMLQVLFESQTSTTETSKEVCEELKEAKKKIAELELKLEAIKDACN